MESDRQGHEALTNLPVSRQIAFNLTLVAILSPFLVACLFVHPMADDFIYASNARAGFWTAWVREYAGWNGRYASNAFVLIAPLAFGWLEGYRVAAAVMIVSTALAVYLFVRALSGGGLTRQQAVGCCLTFSMLYLSQAPSIGEDIFWYTSAVVYHAPLVIALLHLTLVVRYVSRDHHTVGDRLSLALAFLLLAALIGFNEVVMAMMLALYGALVTWSLLDGQHSRLLFGELLAFAGLCALLVMVSPGNVTRQSMFPAHYQFLRSIGMSALQTLRFVSDWASSGSLLLATVVFAPMAAKLWDGRAQNPQRVRQGFWLSVAGLLLVVPVSVFPAYWETGILGQHRTVNTAYFAFLILWFIGVSLWMASGSERASALRSFGHQWRLPLALLLLVALALTRNSYALGLDFVEGRFAAFHREMEARERTLRQCRDAARTSCEIEAIRTKPASFFVLDISPDPHDWVNVAYARYFGLAEVRLSPTTSSHVRY
jgi:uncharacterized protein DUF6056